MKNIKKLYEQICNGYIIAEIGKNYNGDLNLAKEMIKVAAGCGVDAVKFQSLQADKIIIKHMEKVAHLAETLGETETVFDMIKKVELGYEDHIVLSNVAKSEGVEFFSTPEDLEVVDLLERVGVNMYKIASLDMTFLRLIKKVALTNKPMIISTGMSTITEISEVLDLVRVCENENIVLLHCVSSYPPPINEHNLNVIPYLNSVFNIPVGYSDHSEGITIPIAATALGAVVIEKHFTLDKSMPGPDHRMSANPDELKKMVNEIKNVRLAVGSKYKKPTNCELSMRDNVRRKLVASKDLQSGIIITEDMVEYKSSMKGLDPKYIEIILGKQLNKKIYKDELYSLEHIF